MRALRYPTTSSGTPCPENGRTDSEMTTQEAIRAVACPKCGTQYKLRADFSGNVKCKKCHKAFSVGMTQAERKGARTRDKHDQKTAVKLIVICGVALLLIAAIIVMAGNSPSGTSKPRPSRTTRANRGGASLPSNYGKTDYGDVVDMNLVRNHIPVLAQNFVRAMADGDTEKLADLFLFDEYFAKVDLLERHEENRYQNQTEAEQAAKREMVLAEMTDPFLTEVLKRYLIPQIEANEEWVWAAKDATKKSGSVRFRARDDNGKDLLLLDLEMVLRPGLKGSDAERLDSWAVKKVSRKFLQKTLASDKADKRMVDIGRGTDRNKRKAAMKNASKGPPEADPVRQEPLPGTPESQKSALLGHVRVLVDIGSSGPDLNKAREAVEAAGKYAIPFLLNELLDRDHRENEADILASNTVIGKLRDITGQSFGYRPGRATGFGQSQVTATPEERETAVRRWFGWWRLNKRTFDGKKLPPEDEDGEDDK